MKINKNNNQFPKEEINQSIVTRFENQVADFSIKNAIVTKTRVLSYQELNNKANIVANQILKYNKEGISQRVYLLFEHDFQMIIAIIAVLKSGNAYVPLDPAHPLDRLEYIVSDSGGDIILTNNLNYNLAKSLTIDLPNKRVFIINVDELDNEEEAKNLGIMIDPSQCAYILYTSGSTGKPKGVIQNHRNVLHFIRTYTNNLEISPFDKLTLFSTYGFDASIMDIFGALLNGATLYPYDMKELGAVEKLTAWIGKEKITIFHSVPTLYRYFISNIKEKNLMDSVRLVVMGGESVLINDVEAYKLHFNDNCVFINGLGPTESTVTLQYFIDKTTKINQATVPVGYPVEDTKVYLLDNNGREVKNGEIGELVYKSDYLALGYLNQQEKTNAVFITDPVTKRGRVFKTGDLGRKMVGGPIEFLGRNDFQIKIKGYRIELNEIESVIDNFYFIDKSVVMPIIHEEKESQIIAYYTTKGNKSVSSDLIKEYLLKTLPSYMIPTYFYQLDSVPLTATGKIDRKFIVDTFKPNFGEEKNVKPKNAVERNIVKIWKKLLNIDVCGTKTEFSKVGGNSLLLTSLALELQNKFKIDVAINDIINLPTIEKQAEYIIKNQK
ncbi:MAG: amino acid adenylation domain-containing protein [Patescibacteria group bacterium]|jgi:amino acid adenylation domain-containing protein